MKIGIAHPTFAVSGGAEKVSIDLIDCLKATEHMTTLYCVVPPKISETNNFKIQKITPRTFRFFNFYRRFLDNENLFNRTEKEDVLIFTGGGFSLYRNTVPRNIVYCHGSFSQQLEMLKRKSKDFFDIYDRTSKYIFRKRFSYLKKSKVRLISNSNFTRNLIKKRFLKESTVIYPPVNVTQLLNYIKVQKDKKVLTISRFTSEKNLDFAIKVSNKTGLKHEIIGTATKETHLTLYKNLSEQINKEKINLIKNATLTDLKNSLSTSKVYFHPSKETFGIAVVESIASGCIPIVPDNSGHLETVPFRELRYSDEDEARNKILEAMDGKYDYLKGDLKTHAQKFTKEIFQEKMINEIKKFATLTT